MGKIDDMRRQREQQFADAETRRTKAARTAPAAAAPAAAPVAAAAPAAPSVVAPPRATAAKPAAAAPARRDSARDDAEPAQPSRPTRGREAAKKTTSKSGASVDEQGKCPDCGKMKPLSNGVMAQHQKGFGKACAGSRKKPV